MGSSIIPAASSGGTTGDKWVLISSNTSLNGLSAVNFTSISGYRKLYLSFNRVSCPAANLFIRFNSDTNNKYYDGTASNPADGAYATGVTGATSLGLYIDSVDGTGVKPYSLSLYVSSLVSRPLCHYLGDGSAISSVNISLSTGTFGSGFAAYNGIYLYGVVA